MKTWRDVPDLTLEEFRKFAALIHREAGITLREHKVVLLSNRLRKRLAATGCEDFASYFSYLGSHLEEKNHFLEAITTNETYFWRTVDNFELMRREVLKNLLPGTKNLRFWSAGCSTGEEPYNLAIELTEAMKDYGHFEFSILASDISERVVEFGRQGLYSGRRIEKVPPAILARYFRPDHSQPGEFRVREDLRKRVEFRRENLFETSHSGIHCIFCRNVMIYFAPAEQEALVRIFHRTLLPGGYLIIGHSESLSMISSQFKLEHHDLGVLYRKV
jgi:chemotaxis protein methyltransferase CheR